jgi:ankyrin repeat protein
LHTTDNEGGCPLLETCHFADTRMNALRTLLQLGADVNVSKPSGACPLIAAVTNGTTAKVKLLLAAGCNPKVFQHSTGMGCLHLAIAKDDLPVCIYTIITLLYQMII